MRGVMKVAFVLAGLLSLAACGQTPGCRALTGGALGASGGGDPGRDWGQCGAWRTCRRRGRRGGRRPHLAARRQRGLVASLALSTNAALRFTH